MKKSQINELANSIIEHNELSDNDLNWILKNFSRKDLKIFIQTLKKCLKDKTVNVYYAGEISDDKKEKIESMFKNKNINYIDDDENIKAGMKLEFGDYVWDYSIFGIVKRIILSMRESL